MIMISLSFGPECLMVLLIPWPDNLLLSQKYGGDHHPGEDSSTFKWWVLPRYYAHEANGQMLSNKGRAGSHGSQVT
jgi:hypothetical protein